MSENVPRGERNRRWRGRNESRGARGERARGWPRSALADGARGRIMKKAVVSRPRGVRRAGLGTTRARAGTARRRGRPGVGCRSRGAGRAGNPARARRPSRPRRRVARRAGPEGKIKSHSARGGGAARAHLSVSPPPERTLPMAWRSSFASNAALEAADMSSDASARDVSRLVSRTFSSRTRASRPDSPNRPAFPESTPLARCDLRSPRVSTRDASRTWRGRFRATRYAPRRAKTRRERAASVPPWNLPAVRFGPGAHRISRLNAHTRPSGCRTRKSSRQIKMRFFSLVRETLEQTNSDDTFRARDQGHPRVECRSNPPTRRFLDEGHVPSPFASRGGGHARFP